MREAYVVENVSRKTASTRRNAGDSGLRVGAAENVASSPEE
jgi:hypothetical protein